MGRWAQSESVEKENPKAICIYGVDVFFLLNSLLPEQTRPVSTYKFLEDTIVY